MKNQQGGVNKRIKFDLHSPETSSKAHEKGDKGLEERFWDFLYQADCHDREDVYDKMFNPSFELDALLKECESYIQDESDEYFRIVFKDIVSLDGIQFIHARDLGKENSLERAAVNRRFLDLPDYCKKVISGCPRKCKGKCRLIEKNVGLLCFLHNLAFCHDEPKDQEANEENDIIFEDENSNELKDEEEGDEGEDLDLKDEEAMAGELDIISIKYSTIIKEGENDFDKEASDLAIPCLPTFCIGGQVYTLLFDIQCMFKLREDETLALLSQKWKEEKDWVVYDNPFEELDLCFEHNKAMNLVYDVAKEYERSLPSEEEFQSLKTIIPMPVLGSLKNKPHTEIIEGKEGKSINLWSDKYLDDEENSQLEIEADNFLTGSRKDRESGWAKDSGLRNYLSGLKYPEILIIHKKYSRNGYLPLFALKTLSRFLGSYNLPQSHSKVILIELKSAIEVFGLALGVKGSFKGYYLSYGTIGLNMGIRDPEKLPPYGKHFMLRHGKSIQLTTPISYAKELEANHEQGTNSQETNNHQEFRA